MNHNQKVGKFGEKLAQEFLIRRGYEIIDTNIKTSYKEIDIVTYKNEALIFIEVKTRTSDKYGKADETVFGQKIKNLKQAVITYLEQFNKKNEYRDIRLDLIAIDINKNKKMANIKHYKSIA
jgi:putative endonuclease